MKHHGCILLCSFLLVCYSQKSIAQEPEDEREFDYISGSKKGPENWGNLKKEWAVCKNGKSQSPIDLNSKRVRITSKLGRLDTSYWDRSATIKSRGHDVAVEWEGDAGWFRTNGIQYKIVQAHWHHPSEHTINGKRYDLELHMVHKTDDPKAAHKNAVVASFYEIGRPDPFLSKLMMNKATLTGDEDEEEKNTIPSHTVVNQQDIINVGDGMRYYRYIGSLTIPPCTEGVLWTINNQVMTVSKPQLAFLRAAVHDYAKNNARPLQPLNSRWIDFNVPQAESN